MKYKVVEIYKRGEKIFKGRAHRTGWIVYGSEKPGEEVYLYGLQERKNEK